jgi:hypothetical protein
MTDYQCEGWLSRSEQCTDKAIYDLETIRDGQSRGHMFLCKKCKDWYTQYKGDQYKVIPIEQSKWYKK